MTAGKSTYMRLVRDSGGAVNDVTNMPTKIGVDSWEQMGKPDQLSFSYDPAAASLSLNFQVKEWDYGYNRAEDIDEKIGQNTPDELVQLALKLHEHMGVAGYSSHVYDFSDGLEYGTRLEFRVNLKDAQTPPVDPQQLKAILAADGWSDTKIDMFLQQLLSVEQQQGMKDSKKAEISAQANKEQKIKTEGTVEYQSKRTGELGINHYSGIHSRLDADTKKHDYVTDVSVDKEMSMLTLHISTHGEGEKASGQLLDALKEKGIAARLERVGFGSSKITINYQGVPPLKLSEVFSKDGIAADVLPAEAMDSLGISNAHANTVAGRPSGWAAAVRS